MKGLFVVGTDTEVGKTILSAALVAALRARGLDASYMKPVGSDGIELEGRLVSPDALFAARAAGLNDPWERLNPVCLPLPLSPLAASETSGLPIDLGRVPPAWEAMTREHDFVVVEGVGGLLAPVTDRTTAADLVRMLNVPCLVVGRPSLGTINHTLLTLEALDRRGIETLGFCYSGGDHSADDPSRPTNARHTRLFTRAPFFGVLPRLELDPVPSPETMARAGEALSDLLDLIVKR